MTVQEDFQWTVQPQAAALVAKQVDTFAASLPALNRLRGRLLAETGTRLVDWVDHFVVDQESLPSWSEVGFAAEPTGEPSVWGHHEGLFPTLKVADSERPRLAMKVESVVDFLAAHRIEVDIQGGPVADLRMAKIEAADDCEWWVVQRHGNRGFEPTTASPGEIAKVMEHSEAFQLRRRDFPESAAGFEHTMSLVEPAVEALGVDRACDLFFEAERRYWQQRNEAAQIQKRRQDRLGLGWANHDHHTYRSSRAEFAPLIRLLEMLGFQCRERFYGGAEAGWGAQVLEQPRAGIVIFADVDLSPQEVMGDFAHEGLAPRDALGTVGLWCALHGEAMLQAGMHHLECQFDFEAARQQLAIEGIETMTPFSELPHLRQAFTRGERWPVAQARIDAALRAGWISRDQANRFAESGTIGSHLEILERNDGYKGFNQTGINEIIRDTDPRN